jgi:hypothetical protein
VQGQLTRWILKLQEYDYELIYIPGKKNVVADALSRKPIAKKNDGIDKIMAMINDEKEKHKEAEEEHRIVAGIKGKERKREKEERKTARELTNESVKKREEVEGEDLTEEEKGRAKVKKDKQIMGEKMTTRTRTRTARQLEKWAEGELDEEGQRDCIADMQMKDTTLETIRKKAKTGKEKGRWREIDGILYKIGYIEKGDENAGRERLQVIIPTKMRNMVLERMHDAKIAGHLGVFKTYESVKKKYWWPKMREEIRDYIRTCQTCQKHKSDPKSK